MNGRCEYTQVGVCGLKVEAVTNLYEKPVGSLWANLFDDAGKEDVDGSAERRNEIHAGVDFRRAKNRVDTQTEWRRDTDAVPEKGGARNYRNIFGLAGPDWCS
jgi:hypothetical protein